MFRAKQQIGVYTLIRKLGQGGFGEVWLAERKGKFVTTKVAVKLPLDEQVDHAAVEQEAKLWEQASGHPNVMPIIEADEYDGQIVIVSEYAPDGSLAGLLKTRGKLSVKESVEMTVGILGGLEFLHSRNIIHRDLKPANILLQGTTPRLADFGISRVMRTTMTSQSQHISGTFAYMSPEALDGRRSVQTDIWAVGVNLYQFLTGNLPFPQKEFTQLLFAIAGNEPEPLPDFVPPELKRIIAKSLEKLPEKRYKTASAMREVLQRLLQGNSEKALEKPFYEVLPTESSPVLEEIVSDKAGSVVTGIKAPFETETIIRPVSSQKKSKTNPLYFAVFAVVLLILAVTGGYWVTGIIGDNGKIVAGNNSAVKNENINAGRNNTDTKATTNSNIKSGSAERNLTQVILPDGTKLQAYPGGIEDQLVKFIESDEYKNGTADSLKNIRFAFDDLNFKFGSTEIVESSKRQMDNIAAILKAFPNVQIKIGGHTDKRGDDAANKKLSDERAKAVKAALDKAGVGAQIPEAEGYGEDFATVPETASDEERKIDRKMTVSLLTDTQK